MTWRPQSNCPDEEDVDVLVEFNDLELGQSRLRTFILPIPAIRLKGPEFDITRVIRLDSGEDITSQVHALTGKWQKDIDDIMCQHVGELEQDRIYDPDLIRSCMMYLCNECGALKSRDSEKVLVLTHTMQRIQVLHVPPFLARMSQRNRSCMMHTPTDEQAAIVFAACESDRNLLVSALAGLPRLPRSS
jgi:hypothetical protein